MTTVAPERLDAHLHLWRLGGGGYRWLGPEHGALCRSFGAAEAWTELDSAGVGQAILVQADDTLADTRAMLDAAAGHGWIAGVVGWIQLDSPETAGPQLEEWLREPVFCGLRHLVHDEPRENFLALPQVRESLGLAAEAGMTFDVPDAFPRHLAAAADLAEALPELTVVVDHLGKPPLGTQAERSWRAQLSRFTDLPNTAAKVSGLHLPGVPYTAAALRPAWDTALEVFGPQRLMFGGDWPVSTQGAPYRRTVSVLAELIGRLDDADARDVWAATAKRTYRRGRYWLAGDEGTGQAEPGFR